MAKKIAKNEINVLQFYNVKEVAEKLEVHPRTIIRNIHAGNIAALQLGGKGCMYKIPGKEFLRLLNK